MADSHIDEYRVYRAFKPLIGTNNINLWSMMKMVQLVQKNERLPAVRALTPSPAPHRVAKIALHLAQKGVFRSDEQARRYFEEPASLSVPTLATPETPSDSSGEAESEVNQSSERPPSSNHADSPDSMSFKFWNHDQ